MKQAYVRLAALFIVLINQFLVTFGWTPLPFSDEEIYEGVSVVATFITTVYVWYKNNDITEEAEKGTALTRKLKAQNKRKEGGK